MCLTCIYVDFAEDPVNITLLLGSVKEVAVFRCQHHSPDPYISWRVNGTSIRHFPDIIEGSIRENGTEVTNTLTIPARSEYNGTEVVCLAFSDDGSREETPPAKLYVMRG